VWLGRPRPRCRGASGRWRPPYSQNIWYRRRRGV